MQESGAVAAVLALHGSGLYSRPKTRTHSHLWRSDLPKRSWLFDEDPQGEEPTDHERMRTVESKRRDGCIWWATDSCEETFNWQSSHGVHERGINAPSLCYAVKGLWQAWARLIGLQR